ncbi:hypothetical protein ACFO1B_21230 [Dactylosporangium siamense]|uniref:Uncharacterized protein n=1 Tax=Dactylosporangium siamense TaxID=685454 RepID=A0A919U9D0_9ACTN|nr:hypothetical protein [Dactylosporangium siamense]GIG46737.1 hypothetical protein Dsi01nite_047780 [Dactylosporangium siamense]
MAAETTPPSRTDRTVDSAKLEQAVGDLVARKEAGELLSQQSRSEEQDNTRAAAQAEAAKAAGQQYEGDSPIRVDPPFNPAAVKAVDMAGDLAKMKSPQAGAAIKFGATIMEAVNARSVQERSEFIAEKGAGLVVSTDGDPRTAEAIAEGAKYLGLVMEQRFGGRRERDAHGSLEG